MPAIHFTKSKGFIGNRPYADIVLVHGSRSSPIFSCIVDTGADYTILPANALALVGLAVPHARITVNTVGAAASFPFLTGVDLEIESFRIKGTDILVDTTNSLAILSRTDLLRAYDAGFDPTQWHWT